MFINFKISNGMRNKNIFYVLIPIIFLAFFYIFFFSAPRDFPIRAIVEIEPGMNLRDVSSILKKQHIIRSIAIFESFVIIFGAELHIGSADYLLENKMSVWEITKRIARGEHRMAPVVITIPEGFNTDKIGDIFESKLPNFNKSKFLSEAKELEGYLFPDTYFFLTKVDEKGALKIMNDNFKKKITPFLSEIISLGKNEKDIIVMASIIERESKGDADRGIISGILWKRININMPLQVDAVLETYKTKGLPKSPIGNPGLLAIMASIRPQSSPYFYYLHDKDGMVHYAKTFAEHKKNVSKYLK